jgi:hypothetical protein
MHLKIKNNSSFFLSSFCIFYFIVFKLFILLIQIINYKLLFFLKKNG